ncbi:polycomb group protein EMBRYONIC FLOWER 2-like [Nicotiana sylvestris]|uniref:polycomb group protein EMBRYONIC FLOWER 2-like n=1 Tax=Nicotiana sylvestris TaxID=4096 RepID=UPI00388C7697
MQLIHLLIPLSRLRTGNVVFNYRYYNNKLQRTEVTEDFTCPSCLVKCASFKGLRYHLCSSHDLFNFEFWVNEVLRLAILHRCYVPQYYIMMMLRPAVLYYDDVTSCSITLR